MEKVIVKKEGAGLVFFFPDSPARPGYIECWSPDEGHGEASLEYFWGLKKPGADQEQAISNLIKRYEKHYETELKRVYKRRERYAPSRGALRTVTTGRIDKILETERGGAL